MFDQGIIETVTLVDIREPKATECAGLLRNEFDQGRVRYVRADVREPIVHPDLPERADLVVNLAAVYKDPGHEPHEYFETNVEGAERICAWTENVGCHRLVFTSSVSCYGPTEDPRDETSLPTPVTPYGVSKLLAEKIHLAWQRGASGRKLLIVRPGIIFGVGENENVTRLVRSVLGRYFFYMSNRGVRKAGGYVKELCRALAWVLARQETSHEDVVLFNFTLDPPPSLEEYVSAICKAEGVNRWIPNMPYPLVLGASYVVEGVGRLLGIALPISPVRVRKLTRSSHIEPAYLRRAGYRCQYTLEEAFEDWKREQCKSSGATRGAPALGTPWWARFRRKHSGVLLD
jgi:nucleoside-diphosphate-sugar epimerase